VAARSRGTGDLSPRMAPALAGAMAPDDKVVASTVAVRATFFLGYLVIMLALLVGFFATAGGAGPLGQRLRITAPGVSLNLFLTRGGGQRDAAGVITALQAGTAAR
jgi:hypothetical protein